jgi:uncharacterized membrane protein YgaE (UPF0421/DUF939 family)
MHILTSKEKEMATKIRERREITDAAVREIVDEMLRGAFRTQARELEKHLTDIHERLQKIEVLGRPR